MSDESPGEATIPSAELGTDPTQAWAAPTQPPRARRLLGRGTAVGRYLILSTLGAGGMGVVYAAHDPELDRKVALKLLRADGEGAGAREARTRLLREAQALAKLAHPNVVAIHDVGAAGDEVFLAMELVDGRPLGDWVKLGNWSWREKLHVVIEAGRGVAAAHAAGLLHRDLKPDNIMVAADGRVRVMDLGLARARASGDDQTVATAAPELAALAVRVTQAGAIMGTPAYMAPEQFRGEDVGIAADQFALCVTAWQLLAGRRPFTGDTLLELAANVLAGKRSPAPRGSDVPRWIWPILERGLATVPGQRWPSVDALLLALERGQARARRRWILGGVTAIGIAAASVAGWRELDERRRVAACEAAGQTIFTGSWTDTARQGLREGLLASGAPSAPTVVDKTLPWLDAYAAAWSEARTGACMDAEVRGAWSTDVLNRSTWCLDERRLAFEALVAELGAADQQTIHKATTAAAKLPPVQPCRDADRLTRLPAPPADRAEAVEVRAALARAGAMAAAAKYDDALTVAEPALDRARKLGWPPLIADAGYRVGDLLDSAGRYDDAEAALTDAYFTAVKSGTTDTAADAATLLVFTVGYKLARHDDGKAWARHADAALTVLGEPDDSLRRANLQNSLAQVYGETGAYNEARVLYERVLTIYEVALGPEHPVVATPLNNLAINYRRTDAHDQAQALLERAIAIYEVALGPDHPNVAMAVSNLANVRLDAGAYDEVEPLLQRAISIDEATLGPDHPDFATSLNNLAAFHHATGAYDEAKALLERVLAIYEAALGPDHPDVTYPLIGLAEVALAQGQFGEAIPLAERAAQIREASHAPAELIAQPRFTLARALWDAPPDGSRDPARARALAEQAREAYAATDGSADLLAEVTAWLAAHRELP